MVVFLCTPSDDGLYLYKNLLKIFLTVLKLQSGNNFHRKKFKGALFHKNIVGVTVFSLQNV